MGSLKNEKPAHPGLVCQRGWLKTLPFISASEEQFAFLKLGLRSCQKLAQCSGEVGYGPTNITHGKCVKSIFVSLAIELSEASASSSDPTTASACTIKYSEKDRRQSSSLELVYEAAFLDLCEGFCGHNFC